jgi:predicted amidohydrolase YtcJ
MEKADLILKNGFIYTVDKKRSTAEAVAVEGNKIVYVGDIKGVEPFVGNNTKLIDLDGKMLFPGFVEAHAHPFMATCWLSGIIIDIS